MVKKDRWVLLKDGIAKLRSFKKGVGWWAKPIVKKMGPISNGYIEESEIVDGDIKQEMPENLYGISKSKSK